MEISWDGALPTQEQWESLQGRAFECLEDIKGAQTAISTRAMLELLSHGAPTGSIREPYEASNGCIDHRRTGPS